MGTPVDLQELGAELRIYGEIDDPAMRYFNPSVMWDGDKLKIAIRSCNFMVDRGGPWSFRDGSAYSRTDVIYGDLDPDTMQTKNLKKLKIDEKAPMRVRVAGLEDVRLFPRKDGMHAIGFESDRLSKFLHNETAKLAEFVIKGDTLKYIRTLDKPDKTIPEKNWSPADVPSDQFDFTYSDTQIWKNGKVLGRKTTTQIHGGSTLLLQDDGTYLSLVHEKVRVQSPRVAGFRQTRGGGNYDKFMYVTYLARHNEKGLISKISKPFRFGTLENIEFASGFVEYKDDFIMTLGVRDCKYAIAKISKEKLLALL